MSSIPSRAVRMIDGQVDRSTAKGMQHCEPVKLGEPDVQDHQVELAAASHGKGLDAASHKVVVRPLARSPFSMKEAIRASSSAIKIWVTASTPAGCRCEAAREISFW